MSRISRQFGRDFSRGHLVLTRRDLIRLSGCGVLGVMLSPGVHAGDHAPRNKVPLPPVEALKRRCKALAALDLIFSPEWEERYYSFNSAWSPGEAMASMRNGSGDEWFILFHQDGWAALKGLDHESKAWSKHRGKLSRALQASIPKALASFATEPAFSWDQTSFAYIFPKGAAGWQRINDLTEYSADDAGDAALLALLHGGPADYAAFATDYYETKVEKNIVADIFELRPITAAMVKALNPKVTLEKIAKELHGEIGYPKGKE